MTNEHLSESREKQANRYPALHSLWKNGRYASVVCGAIPFLIGLSLVFSGHDEENTAIRRAYGSVGFAFILSGIATYFVSLACIELVRVFLDVEIHVRRFVDGD